jgi:hypothetical protein
MGRHVNPAPGWPQPPPGSHPPHHIGAGDPNGAAAPQRRGSWSGLGGLLSGIAAVVTILTGCVALTTCSVNGGRAPGNGGTIEAGAGPATVTGPVPPQADAVDPPVAGGPPQIALSTDMARPGETIRVSGRRFPAGGISLTWYVITVDGAAGQINLGTGRTDNQGAFEYDVKIPETMCTVPQGQLYVTSTRDGTALTAPLAVYSDRC